MRITKVELKNFKRFTDLTIDGIPPDAKLVLLIGANGSGKSSVFDAFEIANSMHKREDIDLNLRKYLSKDQSENPRVALVVSDDFHFFWGSDSDLLNLPYGFDSEEFDTRNYNPHAFYERSSLRQVPRLTRTQFNQATNSEPERNSDHPLYYIDYGAPQLLDRISAFSGLLDEARKWYFSFYTPFVPHRRGLITQ